MTKTTFWFAWAFLFCTWAGVVAQDAKSGTYEDKRYGFKMKLPDKWGAVPVGIDEKWIVCKYLCDKSYQPKKGEFFMDHKPQLRVIVFAEDATKFKGPKIETEETSGGRTISVSQTEVPFRDYKDYLKRNLQEGFFFSSEKQAQSATIPCWQYEVKIEKLTVPRRLVTWVFKGDAAEYAVEFEVLEDHYEKLLPTFMSTLQSFRFIPRESSAVGNVGATTGGGVKEVDLMGRGREEWKKLPAKERADKRKSTEESRFHKAKQGLPAGWTTQTTPHFLVLTHADAKYTQKVVDAAEACRKWLDDTLGGVSDEYVLKAIIRVCADQNEARAYVSDSTDSYNAAKREVVTYKDASMGSRSGFERLFSGLYRSYLYDKDPYLLMSTPDWLDDGMAQLMSAATPKGQRLETASDTWEADRVREAMKGGKGWTARALIEMPADKFRGSEFGSNAVMSGRLVRTLLTTKEKFLSDFIVRYYKAVIEVSAEMNKDDRMTIRGADETEEQEEARLKERKQAGTKRAAELRKAVHEKVLTWTDKEWGVVEAAFAAAIK